MFQKNFKKNQQKNISLGLIALMALMLTVASLSFGQDELDDKYKGKAHSSKKFRDAIEMEKYVIGFLLRGPNWTAEDNAETQKLNADHMRNINRLADELKLVISGPFLDAEKQGDMAGMFIFRTEFVDSAKAWASTDPAVQAGRFTMEYHPWYGPKTLRY